MITAMLGEEDAFPDEPIAALSATLSPDIDEEVLLASDGDAGSCGRSAEKVTGSPVLVVREAELDVFGIEEVSVDELEEFVDVEVVWVEVELEVRTVVEEALEELGLAQLPE